VWSVCILRKVEAGGGLLRNRKEVINDFLQRDKALQKELIQSLRNRKKTGVKKKGKIIVG